MSVKFKKSDTLESVHKHLRSKWESGTSCPACGQYVKVYKRKFNAVMSRGLISLYMLGEGYHHVKDIMSKISPTGTNDFSKLKYYKFIEEKENTDTKKRTSGLWKITENGKAFAENRMVAPSHVLIFNNKIQGFVNTNINIIESLGKKFNYKELMSNE